LRLHRAEGSMHTRSLVLLFVLSGCATTPPPDEYSADQRDLDEAVSEAHRTGKWMKFASADEVPVGHYVAGSYRNRPVEYVLSRHGDGFRFEVFDDKGVRVQTYDSVLTSSGMWLTLPGHHGLSFYEVDGEPVLHVLYCYEWVNARPRKDDL
jgi:hypothetical protein